MQIILEINGDVKLSLEVVMTSLNETYNGFEVGPIRPPSEAASLLIRITRNCPWNKCTFCSLYKGEKFSVRPMEHILRDIDKIKMCVDTFKKTENMSEDKSRKLIRSVREELGSDDAWAYSQALSWYRSGMESIFLQDANSLVIKAEDMTRILKYIREQLGDVGRITSYARSHTVARISDENLKAFEDAGLNRIHIGMESASDEILTRVKKGADKATHIQAGKKVKKTGIELSEYFMPGLGGNEFSKSNALETADALNQINPDFIRIRTLAVTKRSELIKDYENGMFTRANDVKMVKELYDLLSNLNGITSTIKSDHILNLIPEFEGELPKDKNKMLSALKWYLDLSEGEQDVYRLGRRIGIMNAREDLNDEYARERVEEFIKEKKIGRSNIDQIVDELMNRFI